MKTPTVRIKRYKLDDYYMTKEVTYTTLVPSMYNFHRNADGSVEEILDGFNFDTPGASVRNFRSGGRAGAAGGSYFLSCQDALSLVHPEDRYVLESMKAAAA